MPSCGPAVYATILAAHGCPLCGAPAGTPCQLTRTEKRHVYDPWHFIHLARYNLWLAAQGQRPLSMLQFPDIEQGEVGPP